MMNISELIICKEAIFSNLNLNPLLHRDQQIIPNQGITVDSNFMKRKNIDKMTPDQDMPATILEKLLNFQMESLIKHHVEIDLDPIQVDISRSIFLPIDLF